MLNTRFKILFLSFFFAIFFSGALGQGVKDTLGVKPLATQAIRFYPMRIKDTLGNKDTVRYNYAFWLTANRLNSNDSNNLGFNTSSHLYTTTNDFASKYGQIIPWWVFPVYENELERVNNIVRIKPGDDSSFLATLNDTVQWAKIGGSTFWVDPMNPLLNFKDTLYSHVGSDTLYSASDTLNFISHIYYPWLDTTLLTDKYNFKDTLSIFHVTLFPWLDTNFNNDRFNFKDTILFYHSSIDSIFCPWLDTAARDDRYNFKDTLYISHIDTSNLATKYNLDTTRTRLDSLISHKSVGSGYPSFLTKWKSANEIDTSSLLWNGALYLGSRDLFADTIKYMKKIDTASLSDRINAKDYYGSWTLQGSGANGSNITSFMTVNFVGSGNNTATKAGNTITITGDTSGLTRKQNIIPNLSDTSKYLKGADTIALRHDITATALSGSGTANFGSMWTTTTTLGKLPLYYYSPVSGEKALYPETANTGINNIHLGFYGRDRGIAWYGHSDANITSAILPAYDYGGAIPDSGLGILLLGAVNSANINYSYPAVYVGPNGYLGLNVQAYYTNGGIKMPAPPNPLSVANFTAPNTYPFQVNGSGDIVKLKNLTYSWPSSHVSSGYLKDDGSGNLTWGAISISNGSIGALTFVPSPITGSGTIYHVTHGVGGTYTNPTITCDGYGHVTSISNGDAGSSSCANDGAGTGTIYEAATSAPFKFKSLLAGSNITLVNNTDNITISSTGGGAGGGGNVFKAGSSWSGKIMTGYNDSTVIPLDWNSAGWVLKRNGSGLYWGIDSLGAAGSGEANTASNVGAYGASSFGLWYDKNGYDLRFKSLYAGTGITLTALGNSDIEISAATNSGEANLIANAGSGNYVLGLAKSGVNLPIKRLAAGTNITIDSTDGNSLRINSTGGITSLPNPIGADSGGTGLKTYSKGDILYAGSNNPESLSKLAAPTSALWQKVIRWDSINNIPQWGDDQTGSAGGGITSLNGLNGSSQSFEVGTSGIDFNISSSGTVHTFNIPYLTNLHEMGSGILTWNDYMTFYFKVSFPGLGYSHTKAAYGDHNHDLVYQPIGTYISGITTSVGAIDGSKPITYSAGGIYDIKIDTTILATRAYLPHIISGLQWSDTSILTTKAFLNDNYQKYSNQISTYFPIWDGSLKLANSNLKDDGNLQYYYNGTFRTVWHSGNLTAMFTTAPASSGYIPMFTSTQNQVTNSFIQQTSIDGIQGINITSLGGCVVVVDSLRSRGDIVNYYNSSDIRLKSELHILEPWNVLNNLNGYRFTWNSKGYKPGTEDVGLIAQSVQNYIPTAVFNRGDGYLGVHLEKLTPYLLEAVKDLKKENKELKSKIQDLEERLSKIESIMWGNR